MANVKTFLRLGAIIIVGSALTSCAYWPKFLTLPERQEVTKANYVRAQNAVKPVGEVLGLNEAIARAIKYNMDFRTKMMEQAIAMGVADLSNYDLLPKVVANAGYNYRNNEFITAAKDSVTGEPSTSNPFINSDKKFSTSNLNLNWNLLDFGVSYYTAKQNADRILIASEKRRRTMHVLVQDVQTAYIRAASAQKLKVDIKKTILDANEALAKTKEIEAEGLQSPLDTLKFKKALLDNMKTLETVDQELSSARLELNQLVNLPANSVYELKDPDTFQAPSSFSNRTVEEFEVRALLRNADLNQSIYSARVARQEVHKSLLKILPNLNFVLSPQQSSNSFLINKDWLDGSAALSFNLWNVLTYSDTKKIARLNEDLALEKRAMVQMAVVTQVYLAKMQLLSMDEMYQRASEIDAVDTRIAKIVSLRQKEGAASKAEEVAANATMILSRLRKYQALSQLFLASGRMQATIGLEPELSDVNEMNLEDLTHVVKNTYDEWNAGKLPALVEVSDVSKAPINLKSSDEKI
jgi:outer membrane protein TolC